MTRLKRTTRYGWLGETPATVLVQQLRDQDRAFANCFAGRAGFAKFRKRRAEQAIRFQLDQRQIHRTFDANDRRVVLAGLGPVKLKWSRRANCPQCSDAPGCPHCPKPKRVTVRRDAAGRYFVSFMVEETLAASRLASAPKAIGAVDLGLTRFVVDAHDHRIPALRALTSRLRQLRRAQRVLSETLNVRGMMRNRCLARAIADAGWGELRRQIAYKAQWAGRTHVEVDP